MKKEENVMIELLCVMDKCSNNFSDKCIALPISKLYMKYAICNISFLDKCQSFVFVVKVFTIKLNYQIMLLLFIFKFAVSTRSAVARR